MFIISISYCKLVPHLKCKNYKICVCIVIHIFKGTGYELIINFGFLFRGMFKQVREIIVYELLINSFPVHSSLFIKFSSKFFISKIFLYEYRP